MVGHDEMGCGTGWLAFGVGGWMGRSKKKKGQQ